MYSTSETPWSYNCLKIKISVDVKFFTRLQLSLEPAVSTLSVSPVFFYYIIHIICQVICFILDYISYNKYISQWNHIKFQQHFSKLFIIQFSVPILGKNLSSGWIQLGAFKTFCNFGKNLIFWRKKFHRGEFDW